MAEREDTVELDADDAPRIPRPEPFRTFFQIRDVQRDPSSGRIEYLGESLVPEDLLIKRSRRPFREAGYEIGLESIEGGHRFVATPIDGGRDGIPWVNVGMFVATVLSTLFVGAHGWYYIPLSEITDNPLVMLRAWPFTAAVLGVLLVHELGHYALGRYHGVDVSLPYVIPFVFPFGTLGAVIRMRGRMPSRKALFDIGAAGPIAGLFATVVVTCVGLLLGPITVPEHVLSQSGTMIRFNHPPLLTLIANVLGTPTDYSDPRLMPHPVIMGGWIGMFFTLLNLIPVGQLDGGHMTRAMFGERQETVSALVPGVLFALAAYLYFGRGLGLNESVGLWAFWGGFTMLIAFNGTADPDLENGIGWPRMLVGLATFAVGALCFLLVPIEVIPPG